MSPSIQEPFLHKGSQYTDDRGTITYNNDFDATSIKRMYTIENLSTDFKRGWQGHKIEQRWFSAMKGCFVIEVKPIIAFEQLTLDSAVHTFLLEDTTLDYLQVPAGHVTRIQALEKGAKLLALSDYHLGEIQDEYRF
jgi:hypothetical protein